MQGIEEAINKIAQNLKILCGSPTFESPILSQVRHKFYLEQALISIDDFLTQSLDQHVDLAILAHKLRTAVRHIGAITGEVGVEDVLDVIFRDFCIGK